MYVIKESNIPIGFFQNIIDRDKAFDKYVLPMSNNCMKSEVKTNGI